MPVLMLMCVYASSSTEASQEEDQVTLCRFTQEHPAALFIIIIIIIIFIRLSLQIVILFLPNPCMFPGIFPVGSDC